MEMLQMKPPAEKGAGGWAGRLKEDARIVLPEAGAVEESSAAF